MISFSYLEFALYALTLCGLWFALGRLTAPRAPAHLALTGTPDENIRALGHLISPLMPPKTGFVLVTVNDSKVDEELHLQVGRNVAPEGAIAYLQLAATSLSERFPSTQNRPPLTLQGMMPSAKLHPREARVHNPD